MTSDAHPEAVALLVQIPDAPVAGAPATLDPGPPPDPGYEEAP